MTDDQDDSLTFAQALLDTAPPHVECIVTLILMRHGETMNDLHGVRGMRGRMFLTDGTIANRSNRVDPTFQAAAAHLRRMADEYDAAFAKAGYQAVTCDQIELAPKPGEPSS